MCGMSPWNCYFKKAIITIFVFLMIYYDFLTSSMQFWHCAIFFKGPGPIWQWKMGAKLFPHRRSLFGFAASYNHSTVMIYSYCAWKIHVLYTTIMFLWPYTLILPQNGHFCYLCEVFWSSAHARSSVIFFLMNTLVKVSKICNI